MFDMKGHTSNSQWRGPGWSVASLIISPDARQRFRTAIRADTLQSERVGVLYSNLPITIAVSAMLAVILVSVQSVVISPDRLLWWSVAIGLVLAGRAALFVALGRKVSVAGDIDASRWLYWFRVATIVIGIVWGIGGVLLAPSGDFSHKIFTSFILAGLCAGAATSLAIDRISAFGFLFSVLMPQIIFYITEGDAVSIGMSVTEMLFLIFMLASARESGFQLEENFRLRVKAIENESRLRQMLEDSPVATRIADAGSNRVVFANSSYISLIESTPEQVVGVDPSGYYAHPEEYTEVLEALQESGHVSNRLVELRSPGKQVWVKWALASYFSVEYQNQPATLAWLYDITDRKMMEDQVQHMAYHDTLTGLPNRLLFIDRLKQAVANARREQSVLGLAFIDLDNFKPINDQYGHGVGDLVLKTAAERIHDCLRNADTAGRIGGDEFVVLLPSVKAEKNAMEIAGKIRVALNRPFEIEGLTLSISSSIGVAVYPDHADEEQQLIARADIAMYCAKAEGKHCVKAYRPEMQEPTG